MCEHHHDHGHDHHHTHDHSHTSEAGVSRDKKILEYMIGHNAKHAQEMRELAQKLQDTGNTAAAALIKTAAAGFEAANGGLQQALDFIE